MRLSNLEGLPKIPREIIPREFSRYLLLLLFAVEGDHTDFERLFVIVDIFIVTGILLSITDMTKAVYEQLIVTERGKIHPLPELGRYLIGTSSSRICFQGTLFRAGLHAHHRESSHPESYKSPDI